MENWREVKKVELHRHLEGSIRLQTILEGALELGVKLPTYNILELREKVSVLEPMNNLGGALKKMMTGQSILATESLIKRVAYEACRDAYSDGIRVLELRYSPAFINLNHGQLNFDSIHRAVLDGVQKATSELSGKIVVGLIGIISRDLGLQMAQKSTDFVIQNQETFVGIDLAGDEEILKNVDFKKFFVQAREKNLGITIHSGETPYSVSGQRVRESVEELGAQRIGHGVAISLDPRIRDFIVEKGITLEICPTSNVLTGFVGSIKEHPIVQLMNDGVKVTLNSDDPQFFGISLSHEYEILARDLNFSVADFENLNEQALQASFIPQDKIRAVW